MVHAVFKWPEYSENMVPMTPFACVNQAAFISSL